MAIKKEKLNDEVLKKLREFQAKINDSLLALGEIEIKQRELSAEMGRISELKSKFLSEYDESLVSINSEIKSLEVNFPKGEIDLTEGVILVEVPE